MYANNYNVDFVNNTIANSDTTHFMLTSAARATVTNKTFLNVLCTTKNSQIFGEWVVAGALAMVVNVQDATFSANSAVNDAHCKAPTRQL